MQFVIFINDNAVDHAYTIKTFIYICSITDIEHFLLINIENCLTDILHLGA